MRLMVHDSLRLNVEGRVRTMRVNNISGNGQVFMADLHEANVDARNRNRDDPFSYVSKTAATLQKASARRVSVSEIGKLTDAGYVS